MGLATWLRKEKAIFIDDNGYPIGSCKMNKRENKFKYKDKTYNVSRVVAHRFNDKGLIFHHHNYFYNINNSNPLTFNKSENSQAFEPVIEPELYTKLLEAEVLIRLNSVKTDFGKFFTVKNVIIAMAVIGVLIYMFNKGGI